MFYVDDVSVTTSKSITAAELRVAVRPQLGTEQASTSGTSIDFTGIPAGARRISIHFVGVSGNGSSNMILQLGDAGGFETTGYSGGIATIDTGGNATGNNSAGFKVSTQTGTDASHGLITLSLEDASDFTWCMSGTLQRTSQSYLSAGSKSLSAELTQVRITHENGTDAFDAGAINISYQ